MIDNLETLLVLIQSYLFLGMTFGLVYFLRKYLLKKRPKSFLMRVIARAFDWLDGFLFWNVPFRFFLEGYMELAVICFINLKPILMGVEPFLFGLEEGEAVHEGLSNLTSAAMILIMIAIPVFIIYHQAKLSEHDLLNDQIMHERIGSIYEGTNLKNKRGANYNAVFTARRFGFAFTLVMCSG
mmetsp:Transcript_8253/g.12636  ORF Transcript_8253/g.12636 Transcript_8253/m.12636 type:complete len:183 (-) Transcript_8253:1215-1763(-)